MTALLPLHPSTKNLPLHPLEERAKGAAVENERGERVGVRGVPGAGARASSADADDDPGDDSGAWNGQIVRVPGTPLTPPSPPAHFPARAITLLHWAGGEGDGEIASRYYCR